MSQATDALFSLRRLAWSALSIGIDRVLPARRAFPASVDEVEVDWLNEALGARHSGAVVRGFEVLDDHSGTTARARIRLAVETAGRGEPLPETLFLKTTPRGFAQQLFLDATGIGRSELHFYASVRPELPIRAPAVHGIASVANGRKFVLLLEDLGVTGARMARVGDHVSLEEAERVVAALARLHARFWESDRFARDLAWVPSYESRLRGLAWERFVTGQMIGLTTRRHAARFPASLRAIAAFVCTERDRLEWLWSRGDRTFVHGDCHVGNLFFEADDVGFLDWQVCARAPGMRDVSYFMCASLPTALRRAHEESLVATYLAALQRLGVAAPGFDEAWSQHCLFALYTFIATAFTAAAGSALQPEEVGLAGLRRALAAADDLASCEHAMALAEALPENPSSSEGR